MVPRCFQIVQVGAREMGRSKVTAARNREMLLLLHPFQKPRFVILLSQLNNFLQCKDVIGWWVLEAMCFYGHLGE